MADNILGDKIDTSDNQNPFASAKTADQTEPSHKPGNDKHTVGKTSRPTLKDIAYMTGLGVTTVSRALSDAPDIGKATKERVRLVAKQIGYRPNRAGVRLRTGKTNVITIILNTEEEAMGMTAPMVAGISSVIGDTSYHLVVTPYSLSQDPLDPVRYVVETGSADAIILSRTRPDDPRVRYMAERNFPFATHGRTDMGINHAYFDYDNKQYASRAVSLLAKKGRSRIGLLAPPDTLTYHSHLTDGFRAEMDERDLLEIPIHGVNTDSADKDIEAEIYRLMKSRHRPDGIICSSAQSAITATAAIESAGFTIGKEIDVVAKESFTLLKRFRPELIVFQESFHKAGQTLADIAIKVIKGDPPTDLQILENPNY